ncbi:MAG: hypothetical protein JO236_06760 [Mycobacterium sp.]|uniref:type VII secretion target n=1 Tax=Mycobacterium sp. TaxID=1785 RepID=UPI001EC998AB|nr:type VII secretion target [Mycobacterium sp.]MBW0017228.1 hypothetical protein [Mycobacterium sp.]
MRFQSRPSFSVTSVDVPAIYAVADRFGVAAHLINDAVADHLAGLTFSGALAGRAHTARGDALRAALDRLAAQVSQWSRAADEIAVALRAGADHYADTERRGVARIA